MTLRLGEDETVVAVLLPEAIRNVPDGVDLVSEQRKVGLLLRRVRFPLPEKPGGHTSTRLKDGHHVA